MAIVECRCPYLIYQIEFVILKESSWIDYELEVKVEVADDARAQETYHASTLQEVQAAVERINAKQLEALRKMLDAWRVAE